MTPHAHAKYLRSLERAILYPFFGLLAVLTAALVVVPLVVHP